MIEPTDLGLPYPAWRTYQSEVVLAISGSSKRYILLEAPTGAGKSGIAVATHHALGATTTAIVCHTLQLQDQYLSIGVTPPLVTVRGRSNFPCPYVGGNTTAELGPCTLAGPHSCRYYNKGTCAYYKQIKVATLAPISVHNYAYWLIAANVSPRPKPFARPNLLILDEAHLLEDQLRAFIEISLTSYYIDLPQLGDNIYKWIGWAYNELENLEDVPEITPEDFHHLPRAEVRRITKLKHLREKLSLLANLREEWLVNQGPDRVSFKPVWVANEGHKHIFRHAQDKVIMMSATILDRDLFCQGLGLDPDDVDFIRLPSTFPKENRPIISRPIVKVRHGMTDREKGLLVSAIDRILDEHKNEKGLIHTSNYEIAQLISQNSRNKHRLVTHSAKDRSTKLVQFKDSPFPQVLISPSMTTGVDLPENQCRFIIIAKLPFPNKADPQVAQRMKLGPDGLPNTKGESWYLWTTACSLVQSPGRGMRSEEDTCHTYILDAQFTWFRRSVQSMLPEWFKEAVKVETDVEFIARELLSSVE